MALIYIFTNCAVSGLMKEPNVLHTFHWPQSDQIRSSHMCSFYETALYIHESESEKGKYLSLSVIIKTK